MRKYLSIILALSIVFSLSAMVVSADSYVYELGTPTEVNDTTVTIPVIFNPPIEMYAVDVVKVAFTLNGCKLTSVESKIPGYNPTAGETAFNLTGSSEGALYEDFIAGDRVVAVVTITKVTDNATIVIDADNSETGDSYDGTFGPGSSVSPALTLWKAADPEPLPEPTEKLPTTFEADGETYNAVNTTVNVADYNGATTGNVVATYWKNGVTELLTKNIPFTTGDTNITGTAGNASFAVAITNVPSTVVITDVNIVFGAAN